MTSKLALWADICSILGVLISIVGFVITIRNVVTSRKAAEQAQSAATRVRDALSKYDAVAELASAMAIMDEIKRLHRSGAWHIVPDRYSILRQLLVSIKSSSSSRLPKTHIAALNGAIQQIGGLEEIVETALSGKKEAGLDRAQFNSVVSKQLDKMTGVLVSIRTEIAK